MCQNQHKKTKERGQNIRRRDVKVLRPRRYVLDPENKSNYSSYNQYWRGIRGTLDIEICDPPKDFTVSVISQFFRLGPNPPSFRDNEVKHICKFSIIYSKSLQHSLDNFVFKVETRPNKRKKEYKMNERKQKKSMQSMQFNRENQHVHDIPIHS